MTHEYGRHNTNGIGSRNICVVHRQLSVEILYGLQGNCGSDEKMNIFVLDDDPITAAQMMCDKHVPKMILETAQMLASSLRKRGADDDMLLLLGVVTKAGSPYKMAHENHPCTIWATESWANFDWLARHGLALVGEMHFRYGKGHACGTPIYNMWCSIPKHNIESSTLTPFALAMPDEYRPNHIPLSTGKAGQQQKGDSHASGDEAVQAYRAYYHAKTFARWDKIPSRQPDWWMEVTA